MIQALIVCAFLAVATALPLGQYPFGTDDVIDQPLFTSQRYGGSYGPYSRYGGSVVDMMADVVDEPWPINGQGPWGDNNQWTMHPEFTTPEFQWPHVNPMTRRNPWSYSPVSPMEDILPSLNDPTTYPFRTDRLSQDFTPFSGFNQDFTPFSRVNMFRSAVMPRFGTGRLYAKKLLAHMGLLNRKLHQECPESDGGLSYLSCQLDAKSLGSQCFKMIEDHPQFHQCKRHPIVKKSIRDAFIIEAEWQKRLVQCMSTPSISDEIVANSEFGSLPISSGITEDIKTIDEIEPATGTGYDVDVVTTERQCVWKVRSKLSRCDTVALRCPKFRRCYFHPTIKTLQVQRRIVHQKLATVVDQCLQGSLNQQFWGASPSTPFSTFPF